MAALLAVGGLAAGLLVANANTAAFCDGSGTPVSCTISGNTITSPSAIQVNVKLETGAAQTVTVEWSATCSQGGGAPEPTSSPTPAPAQAITTSAGVSDTLTLPFANPNSCTVTSTATLSGTGTFLMSLTWTPAAPAPTSTPAPTAGPVRPVKGYAGKCVDDNRNSSANRAKIQIWTCSGSDQAESWTYSHNQLVHNGKCLNDQYAGGSGSHVILYTCNGASNEHWTELANGELVLKAHGGTLCLDDPAYSTRNGTQLIVYACKDSSNQRWSLP